MPESPHHEVPVPTARCAHHHPFETIMKNTGGMKSHGARQA
jgi:hypothetical protein